jgi:hypothetical protein
LIVLGKSAASWRWICKRVNRTIPCPCKFRREFTDAPKPSAPQTDALFVHRLDDLINLRHPLVRLGSLIDWSEIERTFAVCYRILLRLMRR